jgi:hypothetical protein
MAGSRPEQTPVGALPRLSGDGAGARVTGCGVAAREPVSHHTRTKNDRLAEKPAKQWPALIILNGAFGDKALREEKARDRPSCGSGPVSREVCGGDNEWLRREWTSFAEDVGVHYASRAGPARRGARSIRQGERDRGRDRRNRALCVPALERSPAGRIHPSQTQGTTQRVRARPRAETRRSRDRRESGSAALGAERSLGASDRPSEIRTCERVDPHERRIPCRACLPATGARGQPSFSPADPPVLGSAQARAP